LLSCNATDSLSHAYRHCLVNAVVAEGSDGGSPHRTFRGVTLVYDAGQLTLEAGPEAPLGVVLDNREGWRWWRVARVFVRGAARGAGLGTGGAEG
jgi:hypothetical protein